MMRKVLVFLALIGFAFALLPLAYRAGVADEPNALATAYLERAPAELATANVVTAIVVSYRGFDTLGEVAVLFAATAGVGALLTKKRLGSAGARAPRKEATEVLGTAARLLTSLLALFGVYIFTHGHLTPGGGFQGGVVIATAVLLNILARPQSHLAHGLMTAVESLSGAAYVALGLLGAFLAWGFLDPRALPLGELGKLVSAGAIPLIYSVVGLKVGAELSGILEALKGDRE
ncbi:MAG TPA: sodium:proton antiporter [Spirochaetaceae bacterium]|jgi:multicomponent Na+:H+ antiporter subunit B|nr:sodium:proton antiporter [Spirochaetaceae bacterium]